MGFKLERNPTFTHPIVIRELTDGGRYRTHQFTAIYRHVGQSRMEEIQLQYLAMKAAASRNEPIDRIPTREIAGEIFAGWADGIDDPEGQPLDCTPAGVAQLLEVETVADVLVSTYFEAFEKARTKN